MKKEQKEFCEKYNLTEDQFFGVEKIGGDLYLGSVTSLPDGFVQKRINQQELKNSLSWCDGRFVNVDGIMTEIISTRGKVSTVKIVGKKELSFLVTDGKGKFDHGKSIKEAKSDLVFKISTRNKEDFKHLKLDSVVTFEKGIEAYRVITGACSSGTKHFVETFLKDVKKKYTISEIIKATKGQYGSNEFAKFFQQ